VSLLLQFSYLQLLDVLTTLAFLATGVREANPVVQFALRATPSPLAGLLGVKLAAIALAFYCWRTSRRRLLILANFFFAFLVVWNLVALLARV
jgi:hypothetical protein